MTNIPSALPNNFPEKNIDAKVLSLWQEFNMQFATQASCVNAIFYVASNIGLLSCRYCGSNELQGSYGARVLKCLDCNKHTWFTAGTFFNRIRRPRAWLAAIWFMEHGAAISSSKLSQLVGISQSSALAMLKKLTTVIENHMNDISLAVPSAIFSDVICKRSRQTPAEAHPVAEQEEMERKAESLEHNSMDGRSNCSKDNNIYLEDADCGKDDSKNDCLKKNYSEIERGDRTQEFQGLEQEIYELLSDVPISANQLSIRTGAQISEVAVALVILELRDAITRLPGDQYIRNLPKKNSVYLEDCHIQNIVLATRKFIGEHFHGISRKYLQNYLAFYWCYVDRDRWHCGSLLEACLQFRPVTYIEILNYISPLIVKALPVS